MSSVMKFPTRFFLSTFAVLALSLIFTLAVMGNLSRAGARSVRSTYAHELCLVYDKPKRTGSTTIARSLFKCWNGKYGIEPRQKTEDPRKATSEMLQLKQPIVAHSLRHILFSDQDCTDILTNCRNVFHITSTRTMKSRLASFAKVVSLQSEKGRNFSVAKQNLKDAVALLLRFGHTLEDRYEKGVYFGERRIDVDYVIRHEFFEDDLSALIKAFGCDSRIESTNVHNVKSKSTTSDPVRKNFTIMAGVQVLPKASELDQMNDDELFHLLNNFPTRQGDRLHNEFLRTATDVNKVGLAKASSFATLLKSSSSKSWTKHFCQSLYCFTFIHHLVYCKRVRKAWLNCRAWFSCFIVDALRYLSLLRK